MAAAAVTIMLAMVAAAAVASHMTTPRHEAQSAAEEHCRETRMSALRVLYSSHRRLRCAGVARRQRRSNLVRNVIGVALQTRVPHQRVD